MRHFLTVSFTTFRDEEYLFSRNFQKLANVRCAILTDPKQGRRLQMLHFSSFGTNTQHLFHFSKEVAQNVEVFVEHSQSRVREKRLSINPLSPVNLRLGNAPIARGFQEYAHIGIFLSIV